MGQRRRDGQNHGGDDTSVTFVDWDFANVWVIQEGAGYPRLLWQGPPPLAGMISYWKFEEGAGITAADSADSNTGTLAGPAWSSGKVGGALSFDGIDDYVVCGSRSNLNILNEITLEAWINSAAMGPYHQTIVEKGNFTYSGLSYTLAITPEGKVLSGVRHCHTFVGDGGDWSIDGVVTDLVLQPNTWYHVVSHIRSSDSVSIYVNGALSKTGPIDQTVLSRPAEPLTIGALLYYGGYIQLFRGSLDEVAVYNRGLSAEEIRQHYLGGLHGSGYLDGFVDETPPLIAPHDDITVEAASAAGAVVNFTPPAATDDTDESVIVTCAPASGSAFAFGDTTVTCTATDSAGNQAVPTKFVVHVVDTTRPEITVSAPECVPNGKGKGQNANKITVTARDQCSPNVIPQDHQSRAVQQRRRSRGGRRSL